MSWASFIKNEKVDTIRRTPPMPSNQFTFLAYSQLNANYHLLPNLYFVFDFFFFFLNLSLYVIISPLRIPKITYIPIRSLKSNLLFDPNVAPAQQPNNKIMRAKTKNT